MKCKKGDFGGVKDYNVSIKNRKLLFYGICIWIRLAIAIAAYKLKDKDWFPYIVALVSLMSIYWVKFDKDHCVWWSRKIHYIMICLILLTSIFQVITKKKTVIIPLLLLLDLIIGIISSFLLKWR